MDLEQIQVNMMRKCLVDMVGVWPTPTVIFPRAFWLNMMSPIQWPCSSPTFFGIGMFKISRPAIWIYYYGWNIWGRYLDSKNLLKGNMCAYLSVCLMSLSAKYLTQVFDPLRNANISWFTVSPHVATNVKWILVLPNIDLSLRNLPILFPGSWFQDRATDTQSMIRRW